MPVVMNMRWDGVTPEQYDEARTQVGWEQHAPEGGLIHIASFTDSGLRVTDVWETAADFDRFVATRLMSSSSSTRVAPARFRPSSPVRMLI